MRELTYLMQDPVLIRRLHNVGIRPDQALMVYQELDVFSTGNVFANDFIEGLLRLRRPELGIDVAGAKSLMRRLMLEVTQLARDSIACQRTFSRVTERIRMVNIPNLGPGEARDEDSES